MRKHKNKQTQHLSFSLLQTYKEFLKHKTLCGMAHYPCPLKVPSMVLELHGKMLSITEWFFSSL